MHLLKRDHFDVQFALVQNVPSETHVIHLLSHCSFDFPPHPSLTPCRASMGFRAFLIKASHMSR